jgi:voltage-gated potassium channel
MDARSRRLERAFEWPVTVAVLLVIPVLAIKASDLAGGWDTIATVLDWAIWLTFTVEVVTLLAVVPDRRAWATSHVIDIAIAVLTPPFLSAFAPVRLLRLLLLLPLLRLGPLVRRLLTFEGLRYVALLALLTAIAGGAAFAELEPGQNTADGIYWAISTMTTVGYGNPSPTTTGAKVLAVVVMLVGIGFVAMLTGAIAQRFLGPEIEEEAKEVEAQVDGAAAADIVRELREMSDRLRSLEAALHGRAERG